MRGAKPTKGEARAAWLACLLVEEFAEYEVLLEGDAQSLVNQVVDPTATLDWIIEAEVLTLRAILSQHPLSHFQWIPREGNYIAHNLARWGVQIVD